MSLTSTSNSFAPDAPSGSLTSIATVTMYGSVKTAPVRLAGNRSSRNPSA